MEFCKSTRWMMGMQTITSTNKHHDKARTSVAEHVVQSMRNLQKTLVLQMEEAAPFRLPSLFEVLGSDARSMAVLSLPCAHSTQGNTLPSRNGQDS